MKGARIYDRAYREGFEDGVEYGRTAHPTLARMFAYEVRRGRSDPHGAGYTDGFMAGWEFDRLQDRERPRWQRGPSWR